MEEVYRCPWGHEPELVMKEVGSSKGGAPTGEVFCPIPACPAFSNVVDVVVWNARASHELEVAKIPLDEPIFVLRAKDSLSLVPAYTWIDLAEKKKVNEEKLATAVGRTEEMQTFQRINGSRIPD